MDGSPTDLQTVVSSAVPPSSTREMITEKIKAAVASNPYFEAGALLGASGLALSVTRRLTIVANAFFRQRFIIQTQVTNRDPVYPWILNHINKQSGGQTRRLTVHTEFQSTESGKFTFKQTALPGIGTYYIRIGQRWIKVERNREEQHIQDSSGVRMPLETLTLSTLGTDPSFLMRMFSKATEEGTNELATGLVVYHAVGPQWQQFGRPMRKRELESVVLDEGISEKIRADIEDFKDSATWYYKRGIPYRRGYLFYGPPGTGKTSYIKALASHLDYGICMVSMSDRTLDDDRLCYLLNTAPKHSVIVLEDIDACGLNHLDPMNQHKAFEGMSRVTFSGLLNAIDGVASTDERILFMTTNHIERIDKRLIRPGRIDVEQYFGNCSRSTLSAMFKRFYNDGVSEAEAREFASIIESFGKELLSPAAVQGFLLHHKDNANAVLRAVRRCLMFRRFYEEVNSSNAKEGGKLVDVEFAKACQFADAVEALRTEISSADIRKHLQEHRYDPDAAIRNARDLLGEQVNC